MLPVQFLQPVKLPQVKSEGLILKSSKYSSTNILVLGSETLTAIFLGDEFQYESMPCAQAENWSGVFIGDIELRVDPSSIHDLEGYFPPLGMLTFGKDGMAVVAKVGENRAFSRTKRVPFGPLGGATVSPIEIGISRWEIGRTVDQRWVPLWKVEARSSEA
jgi:hypothetical protein